MPTGKLLVSVTFSSIAVAWYALYALHSEKLSNLLLRQRLEDLTISQSQVLRPAAAKNALGQTFGPSAQTMPSDALASGVSKSAGVKNPEAALMVMGAVYPNAQAELGLSQDEAEALGQLVLSKAPAADIESLLGVTRARQWSDYKRTTDVHRTVSDWRSMLRGTSNPLSDVQAEQMTSLVAEEAVRRSEEIATTPKLMTALEQVDFEEQSLRANSESNARLETAAGLYLNRQQIAVLKNSLDGQVTVKRAALQERRARLEAGDTGDYQAPQPVYLFPNGMGQPGVALPTASN